MNSTIQETGKVLLLLFISLICSGLIGADRERKNRPAGMRTHVIVCLASTLIMYAGIRLKNEYIDIAPNIDPARLAAQILSGIGFLGAGTILKGKDNVHGLTTAATLWSVACIGIVIGANYILAGICGTFMVWMTLRVLAHIEHKLLVNRRLSEVVVEFNAPAANIKEINRILKSNGYRVLSSEITKDDGEHLYTAYFHIRSQASRLSDQEPPDEILERFSFVRSVLTK